MAGIPLIELIDFPTPRQEKTYAVRLLDASEVETLVPVFEKYGADLPDPANSFVVGVVDEDGTVVGFQVTQMRVHVDPLHLEKGIAEHSYMRLIAETERVIREKTQAPVDVFVFAPPGRVVELAQKSGMKLEPWRVLSKRIEPTYRPEPPSDSEPEQAGEESAEAGADAKETMIQ